MILPHGGTLINQYAAESERQSLLEKASQLPALQLDDKNISDLEMIASGAMSPLTGFMKQDDYQSVVDTMHLKNGLAWSIPITLAIDDAAKESIQNREEIALKDAAGNILATMQVEDIYTYNKEHEAEKVYRTTDENHPGVAYVYSQGEHLVGGEITMLNRPAHEDFLDYRLEPAATRKAFEKKGWETIVAFQTRNPIHRAHEYLQKCALEIVDGLLIHPLVAEPNPMISRRKSECKATWNCSSIITRKGVICYRYFRLPCAMPVPGKLFSMLWCVKITVAPILLSDGIMPVWGAITAPTMRSTFSKSLPGKNWILLPSSLNMPFFALPAATWQAPKPAPMTAAPMCF